MFAEVVLILDRLRRRLYVFVEKFGAEGHLCDLLEDYCVMYGFVAVLAPGKRTVVCAKDARNCFVVDPAVSELCCDNFAGVVLILALDLW